MLRYIFTLLIMIALYNLSYAMKVEYSLDHSLQDGILGTIVAPVEDVAELYLNIDLHNVSNGFHILYFQAVSQSGVRSMPYHHLIYKVADDEQPILVSNLEYFIDDDPGIGNGTIIQLSEQLQFEHLLVLDSHVVAYGFHNIGIRARGTNGKWSHPYYMQVLGIDAPEVDNIRSFTWYITGTELDIPLQNSELIPPNQEVVDVTKVISLVDLVQGQSYYLHVYASSDTGARSQEVVVPFTVNWIPQNPLINLDDGNTVFSWDPILGADYYAVSASLDPNSQFEYLGTTTGTTWMEAVGDKKFFRVIAGTSLNESGK